MSLSSRQWFYVVLPVGAVIAILAAERVSRSIAANERRIGSDHSRDLAGSPDGVAVAWLEPARAGSSKLDLVQYRADTNGTRRIPDVAEFSYSPTGELGLISENGESQPRRMLSTLGRNDDQPNILGPADQWWLGPGGAGVLVYRGEVSAWGFDGVVRPVKAQSPIAVTSAEVAGWIGILVHDAAGRLIAVLGDGQVVHLENGRGPVAIARDGSAAALAGCGDRGGVCIWRQGSRRGQVLPIVDVAELEFDSVGSTLAVTSNARVGRRLAVATARGLTQLDDHVRDVAWSKRSAALMWRSPANNENSMSLWEPTTGTARVSCGETGLPFASAVVSPDGASAACLGLDQDRQAGVLWLASVAAAAQRSNARVSDGVVQYGFSPTGNVLWMQRRCARGERGCEIAVAAVSSGVQASPLRRLTGIGRRIEFDDARSSRMLFDSDLHGWEIIVQGAGYHQRLGNVRWDNVALLSGDQVAYLRDEPNGGVFVWAPTHDKASSERY